MNRIYAVFLLGTILLSGCGVGRFLVGTRTPPPYHFNQDTIAVHKRLIIVDLHADSLLWSRDLLERGSFGHVDIPRLKDANVSFQVFGVVTHVPYGGIGALSFFQFWPPRTWFSYSERALYQAEKLKHIVDKSNGNLIFIKTRDDLTRLITRKHQGDDVIGCTLGLEGVHALEGDLSNLNRLYDAGFRMMSLAHLFDNKSGGSSDGDQKGGLSPWGRILVQRIQEKNIILDVAHSSPKAIDDVLEITKKPIIASHTGVQGTCNNQRNLSDKHIIGIAGTGGVIGISAFKRAVCGESLSDTVAAIIHVKKLVGIDHVAIGTDFDGAVTTPIDTSGLPLLTQLLIKEGFTQAEIRKVMGENAINVMLKILPQKQKS